MAMSHLLWLSLMGFFPVMQEGTSGTCTCKSLPTNAHMRGTTCKQPVNVYTGIEQCAGSRGKGMHAPLILIRVDTLVRQYHPNWLLLPNSAEPSGLPYLQCRLGQAGGLLGVRRYFSPYLMLNPACSIGLLRSTSVYSLTHVQEAPCNVSRPSPLILPPHRLDPPCPETPPPCLHSTTPHATQWSTQLHQQPKIWILASASLPAMSCLQVRCCKWC